MLLAELDMDWIHPWIGMDSWDECYPVFHITNHCSTVSFNL